MVGFADVLISAERVALNLLQRLSGIATITNKYVKAVEGTGAQMADTSHDSRIASARTVRCRTRWWIQQQVRFGRRRGGDCKPHLDPRWSHGRREVGEREAGLST